MRVDCAEALRYLGCGTNPDSDLLDCLEDCARELMEVCLPKSLHRLFPLSHAEPDTVKLAGLSIHSQNLSGHLSGCEEAFLFAATLGEPVDRLIRRTMITDMSRAVILQACAASLTEVFCDEAMEPLHEEAAVRDLYLRPRYSPGYGDFPIFHQKDLLAILDCPRKIGLTVTESCMLIPSKSVTAIIGLTPEAQSCHIAKCMTCGAKDCPFRKVERT